MRHPAINQRVFTLLVFLIAVELSCHSALGATYTFGSGVNQFDMEFVPVGSPNNGPDIVPLVWRPMYDMLGYPWPPGKAESLGQSATTSRWENSRSRKAWSTRPKRRPPRGSRVSLIEVSINRRQR